MRVCPLSSLCTAAHSGEWAAVHRLPSFLVEFRDVLFGWKKTENLEKNSRSNSLVKTNDKANEDTLLLIMFLGLRKLENICCGHKMFLNKIRNIFCVPDTKFVFATNVARAGKRGNISVGRNESATMCRCLPVPLSSTPTWYRAGIEPRPH